MSTEITPDYPTPDQQILDLLQQWEESRQAGRPMSLQELAGGNSALAARLQEYLELLSGLSDFLNPKVKSQPVEALTEVGSFQVQGYLGRGGTADVYLCRQRHPARQVALKLLRLSHCEERVRKRFLLEIDFLASLEHPLIARIYDAGVADVGQGPQPYFTMEYVDGRQLSEALQQPDGTKLSIAQILDLFLQVTKAVAYAHEKGVVHGDLKPSNILVTRDGEVKIIDFGLARLFDPVRQGPPASGTTTIQIAGTPHYMSPEQFAGNRQLVDTRSDIYTLGVILYRMLSGRLPHPVEGRSIWEIGRIVQEDPPTRFSRDQRQLRGDLEAIILKSLEKDPSQRYQSVPELVADLECYQQGRPVSARRSHLAANLWRWCRRYPRQAATTAAIASTLLVSLIVAVVSFMLADRRAGELAAAVTELKRQYQLSEQHAEMASRMSAVATRRARQLALTNDQLQQTSAEKQQALTNSILLRASTILQDDPHLASSLLSDTEQIPVQDRGLVWKLLSDQAEYKVARRQWSSGPIQAACFSGDGQRVIVSGSDGIDVLQLPELNRVSRVDDFLQGCHLLATDRAGIQLLYLTARRQVHLVNWKLASKTFLLADTTGVPTALAMSDSGIPAVGFEDGRVLIWTDGPDQASREIRFETEPLLKLQFAPDATQLWAVNRGGQIATIDPATGLITDTVPTGIADLQAADLDVQSRYLVLRKSPISVIVWDRQQQQKVGEYDSTGPLPTVSVTSSGQPRIGLIHRHRVELVDGSGTRRLIDRTSELPSTMAAAASGNLMALGDISGQLVVYRTESAQQLITPLSRHRRIRFSASGQFFAAAGMPSGISVFRVGDPEPIAVLPTDSDPTRDFQFAPDAEDTIYYLQDQHICRWPFLSQPSGTPVVDCGVRVRELIVGSSRNRIYAASNDGRICDVCLKSDTLRRMLAVHEEVWTGLALSPDQTRLATAGYYGRLKLWDIDSGSQLAATELSDATVADIDWSPCGTVLAAGSRDGKVRILDASSLDAVRELDVHSLEIKTVQFSPDGSTLATGGGDGRVFLWDTTTWNPQASLPADIGTIRSLRFHPDSTHLAAAGDDPAIRFWRTD